MGAEGGNGTRSLICSSFSESKLPISSSEIIEKCLLHLFWESFFFFLVETDFVSFFYWVGGFGFATSKTSV